MRYTKAAMVIDYVNKNINGGENMAIKRRDVVTRHNPKITKINPFYPLSVGNGEFAYTADITGMQTFPEVYAEGMPICTQSHWGWHTEPVNENRESFSLDDIERKFYETHGRKVGYITSDKEQEEVFHWLRQNPHRLHLGQIGLDIKKQDNSTVSIEDIENPEHSLNMWSGIMNSIFEIEGNKITTQTCCHPSNDVLAFKVNSELFSKRRLSIKISFPYGSSDRTAVNWNSENKHITEVISQTDDFIYLRRILDNDVYFVKVSFTKGAEVIQTGKHSFSISSRSDELEVSSWFSPKEITADIPSYLDVANESKKHWEDYWSNGGIIDFHGSTDKRAYELERRIILSLYLMAIQCAGSLPPQETGLTFNSWYGKFHLEMHWWHGVHFPMWGRGDLFEKSLWWYDSILDKAKEAAKYQGYTGARWPKMTDRSGNDSPSPIGPLLIWQQPHPIYYAELLYSVNPCREILEKYKEIVFESAEFMASYAQYDEENNRYVLGPALIPAQENHEPQITINPTFELEYWAFGLRTANEWRVRLGLEINAEWAKVEKGLAELPVGDGVYLAHENCPDTYTLYNRDHPSMVGALGILPGTMVDKNIMAKTLDIIFDSWQFDEVWGWDFPMMAMTATRLGRPDLAIKSLLLDSPKNEYLANGHNKQADRADLPVYLPGNGGLLTAIAMMTVGWKGCTDQLPGFPKDGTWKVQWENLNPML